MMVIRGPDEAVIADIQKFPEGLDIHSHGIDEGLGADPCLLGRPLDLLAVFVHPGQEVDVKTPHPLVAGHGVSGHGGIGVTDVELATGVVDRGCNVISVFWHGCLPGTLCLSLFFFLPGFWSAWGNKNTPPGILGFQGSGTGA